MKRQWQEFLEANSAYWSYGLVPALVQRLESALRTGDEAEVEEILDGLATQGVILDENGDLRFLLGLGF